MPTAVDANNSGKRTPLCTTWLAATSTTLLFYSQHLVITGGLNTRTQLHSLRMPIFSECQIRGRIQETRAPRTITGPSEDIPPLFTRTFSIASSVLTFFFDWLSSASADEECEELVTGQWVYIHIAQCITALSFICATVHGM